MLVTYYCVQKTRCERKKLSQFRRTLFHAPSLPPSVPWSHVQSIQPKKSPLETRLLKEGNQNCITFPNSPSPSVMGKSARNFSLIIFRYLIFTLFGAYFYRPGRGAITHYIRHNHFTDYNYYLNRTGFPLAQPRIPVRLTEHHVRFGILMTRYQAISTSFLLKGTFSSILIT